MPRFEFDEGVQLMVDRVPGTNNDRCIVEATTSTAAIKGLCWLIEEAAKELNMSKEEILCRIAVVLMVPGEKAKRQKKGKETDTCSACGGVIIRTENNGTAEG